MAGTRLVFDRLMADGPNQAAEQAQQAGLVGPGCTGNYYLDDEVESRNFALFGTWLARAAVTGNRSVLVAACGDGLETEILARAGYDVTAFDFSRAAVVQTRERLRSEGLVGDVVEYDLADLHAADEAGAPVFPGPYAGVMFAQAAAFLPVTAGDRLFLDAFTALAARAEHGAFYYSTTSYAAPRYQRRWVLDGATVGCTTVYAHEMAAVHEVVAGLGMVTVHEEHFRAGEGVDDYRNDYLLALGRRFSGGR